MATKTETKFEIGDVVYVRGLEGAVVGVRCPRRGRARVVYHVGLLDKPGRVFGFRSPDGAGMARSFQQSGKPRRLSAAALEAARDAYWGAVQAKKSRAFDARKERWDALGDVTDWAGSRSATDRFKVGDVVTVRGPRGNWDATVGAVNLATGKLGIRNVGADRSADPLAALFSSYRRPTREFRWLDPRCVVAVNGKPVKKGDKP
jgi:hypothetical protein